MRIVTVTSTELFIGAPADPLQVVRVEVEHPAGEVQIDVAGDGVSGRVVLAAPDAVTALAAEATSSARAVVATHRVMERGRSSMGRDEARCV